MVLVVDASVVLGWYFPDELTPTTEAARRHVAAMGGAVPVFWWFEIRNVLVVGERWGRVDATQTAQILAQLEALPIHLDRNPNGSSTLTLARAHRLTFYDAGYLELARRLDAPLATLDQALATAARAAHVSVMGDA